MNPPKHRPQRDTWLFSNASEALSASPIRHEDLWVLNDDNRVETNVQRFEREWNKEAKKPKPSLLRAMLRSLKGPIILAFVYQVCFAACSMVLPVIIPMMIKFVRDRSVEYWRGYMYAAIVVASSLIGSLFYYQSQWTAVQIGLRMRMMVMTAVYRKSVKTKRSKKDTLGRIVNLFAADSQLIAGTIQVIIPGFIAPLQLIAIVGLMGIQVGWYCLIPAAVIVILYIPVSKLGLNIGVYRRTLQIVADKRLKLSTEMIQGMRVIKYYAWENSFVQKILKAREREIVILRNLSLTRAFLFFFTYSAPGLTFLFYELYSGRVLSVEQAFTMVTLINLIRVPYNFVASTYVITNMITASIDRIHGYMMVPNIVPYVEKSEKAGVEIIDGDFQWDKDGPVTLKNINIKLKPNQRVMVVGSVGSGKSSLTQVLLGEIPKVAGSVKVCGTVAYVPQQAWIFNATIRENICFGKIFDKDKYERVTHASALIADFAILPGGDLTEIGERGANLSGGQKQRISVARALYSDADIYVLDDPFSAVDSHVGKHLFKHVINGYLKGKSVFLVTNQLNNLVKAHNIIFLQDGVIAAQGRFDELLRSNDDFRATMLKYGMFEEDKERVEAEKKLEIPKSPQPPTAKPQRTAGTATKGAEPEKTIDKGEKDADKLKKGGLTQAETHGTGLVPWSVYSYYIASGKWFLFAVMMMFFLVGSGCRLGSSYWLSLWTAESSRFAAAHANATTNSSSAASVPHFNNSYWLWTYIGWAAGEVICILLGMVFGYAVWGVRVSQKMHNELLHKLSRSVISFFDKTPIGRVLSRLAEDMTIIDFIVQFNFISTLNTALLLFVSLVAIVLGNWIIFLIIMVVIVFVFFFQLYFRRRNIQIQRIEATSRAPPISHLTSTLDGLESIRAYRAVERFETQTNTKIDVNTIDKLAQWYITMWYGLRLEWLGGLVVALVFFGIALIRHLAYWIFDQYTGGVPAANIALAYTAGVTSTLSFFSSMFAETEIRMNSVERVKEYTHIEQEDPDSPDGSHPDPSWPSKGQVEFKDFSFKYRNGPVVLKHLNLTIKPREKIGIVGRTGAGKSSLLQALYRMEEPETGTIIIDGVDFKTVGLYDLRSHLAIIPQDPVLFMGPLRYNLDPFDEHTDDSIWKSLEVVQLKEHAQKLEGQLEYEIEENGRNFSVGQRQLLCMARALLRKSPILLLDEATASVDVDTDALIQKTVRTVFKDNTVIAIAHRLTTIMDSNKIAVLEKGELVEFDSGKNLLKVKDGLFKSMVDATGPKSAAYLKKIARGELDLVKDLEESADQLKAEEEQEKVLKKRLKELENIYLSNRESFEEKDRPSSTKPSSSRTNVSQTKKKSTKPSKKAPKGKKGTKQTVDKHPSKPSEPDQEIDDNVVEMKDPSLAEAPSSALQRTTSSNTVVDRLLSKRHQEQWKPPDYYDQDEHCCVLD